MRRSSRQDAQPARCSAVTSVQRKSVRCSGVGLAGLRLASEAAAVEPVRLDILRINLLQLQAVDHVGQTFTARFIFQFKIKDGAEDMDLIRDINDEHPQFPEDTNRPGAAWYLEQIDFPTALEYKVISRKVVAIGSDLHMVLKVSGTFFESMELQV